MTKTKLINPHGSQDLIPLLLSGHELRDELENRLNFDIHTTFYGMSGFRFTRRVHLATTYPFASSEFSLTHNHFFVKTSFFRLRKMTICTRRLLRVRGHYW